MTNEEYRILCSRPNTFHRGMLKATDRALDSEPQLSSLLREVLECERIPKPDLHRGGEDSDHFVVSIDADTAGLILDKLLDMEAGSVGLNGETTPMASHYASLVDVWTEYVEYCGDGIGGNSSGHP